MYPKTRTDPKTRMDPRIRTGSPRPEILGGILVSNSILRCRLGCILGWILKLGRILGQILLCNLHKNRMYTKIKKF
jgi:hypothetical protein